MFVKNVVPTVVDILWHCNCHTDSHGRILATEMGRNSFYVVTVHYRQARVVMLSTVSLVVAPHMTTTTLTHYGDVTMGKIASQITSLSIVYSTVYSDADQRKHQSSASLAFVWGIHRGPVNSPHKWPVTRKMFPFDDVIMIMMTYIRYSATYSFPEDTNMPISFRLFGDKPLHEPVLKYCHFHHYIACQWRLN